MFQQIYLNYHTKIVTNTTTHRINNQNRLVHIEQHQNSSKLQLQVFPNPFDEITTVVIPSEPLEEVTLSIYNLQGQLLQQQTYEHTNQIQVSRNQLVEGVYIYKLWNKGGILSTGKITIQ